MMAIVRSELVKARSTRATMWTVSLTWFITTVLAVLLAIAWRNSSMVGDDNAMRFAGFYSLTLGQLSLVVFAILLAGTEFSTGTIRPSLIAVPGRGRLYAGKMAAAAIMLLGVSVITVALSITASQVALGEYSVSMADQELQWGIVGACAYLAMIGLFAMGVTAILRSSVAALAIMMPLLFLNAQGLGNLPAIKDVTQYLPDSVGQSMMQLVPDEGKFSQDYEPSTAVFIMLAWVAAALIGGYLMTRRREV